MVSKTFAPGVPRVVSSAAPCMLGAEPELGRGRQWGRQGGMPSGVPEAGGRGTARLGVVALLQRLQVLGLAALAGEADQLVQAAVHHHQVRPELPLPGHQVPAAPHTPCN